MFRSPDDPARDEARTLHSIVGVVNNMNPLNHSMRTNRCWLPHTRYARRAGGQ
jgi:hypothetical protein